MDRQQRGITIIELLIAMFIFGIGIVGILSAIPTGVRSADTVIFQDAAIHLASSKLAELRRDRVDPAVDLVDTSAYMLAQQEPLNTSPGGVWHSFASNAGEPYHYFDGIERYEWKVSTTAVGVGVGTNPPAPADYKQPVTQGAGVSPIGVYKVMLTVRRKGRPDEIAFSQYMYSYGK